MLQLHPRRDRGKLANQGSTRHQSTMNSIAQDENPHGTTIVQLLALCWLNRVLVFWITLVFTLVAAAAAWLVPKRFEASVVISPVSTKSGGQLGGLSSLAGQLGGLASIAGISLNGEGSKRFESIAVLQSESLTERYIKENNLLPVLYRKRWDSVRMVWKTKDPEKMPTLWKANEYFKKSIRDVLTNAKTGLVTLSISWKDPAAAAVWANGLVKMTNEYMRDKAIREAERNIAYLTEQAAKTNIVEARQAIYSIMQTEINQEMLARGNEEYAFRVVDPAVEPEKEKSPQKTLWVLSGWLCGLSVSAIILYLRVERLRVNANRSN